MPQAVASGLKVAARTADDRKMCNSGEHSAHPEPEVIASYCRSRLSSATVAEIEAHLKHCPGCRRAITVQVRRDFAGDGEAVPDGGFSGNCNEPIA